MDINAIKTQNTTDLNQAINSGNKQRVSYLLENKSIDLNFQIMDKNSNPISPLVIAIFKGNLDIIDLLLNDTRTNVNLRGYNLNSPINFVIKNINFTDVSEKQMEIFRKLSEHEKININSPDREKNTPLYNAVIRCQTKVVEQLLKHEAIETSIHQQYKGNSIIHEAVWHSSQEIVRLLLQHSATQEIINTQDFKGYSSLHIAVFKGDVELVDLLLKNKENPNVPDSSNKTPLHYAVSKNCLEIVKLLLESESTEVNAKDRHGVTPFLHAIECKHIEIIDFFLENIKYIITDESGNKIKDSRGNTALHFAVLRDNTLLVEKLLNQIPDLAQEYNNASKTPLHFALSQENKETIDIFVQKKGLSTNDTTFYSNTDSSSTLNRTISRMNHDREKRIKEANGKDLIQCDQYNQTSLYYAILNNDKKGIKTILPKLTSNDLSMIKAYPEYKQSALLLAVTIGDSTVVNLLLSHPTVLSCIQGDLELNTVNFVFLKASESIQRLSSKREDPSPLGDRDESANSLDTR